MHKAATDCGLFLYARGEKGKTVIAGCIMALQIMQAGSLRFRRTVILIIAGRMPALQIISLSRHDVTRWVVGDIDRGETVTTKTKKKGTTFL